MNLKSASLINAIFVCLMVSIISSGLISISYYHKMFENKLESLEAHINRNESALNYYLNNKELVNSEGGIHEFDLFDDGIVSHVKKKSWGFYDVVTCKTEHKTDSIRKTVLVGYGNNKSKQLALYLTDYDKALKLSGATQITGTMFVPNGRTELAYINGNKGNSVVLKGSQKESKNRLPKLDKDVSIEVERYPFLTINALKEKADLVNAFDAPTKVLDFRGIEHVKDVSFKGNFILYSNSVLSINASAVLEDIIVKAPVVNIAAGFKGTVQIIADTQVVVEDNVVLRYPSSIYIKNDEEDVSVVLNGNSKVLGGIVIHGNTYNNSLQRQLTISKDAMLIGDIYCYGRLQLDGSVLGSVYTDRFTLKTKSSSYENTILNGKIDNSKLPAFFVRLPLFNRAIDKSAYEVIKTF